MFLLNLLRHSSEPQLELLTVRLEAAFPFASFTLAQVQGDLGVYTLTRWGSGRSGRYVFAAELLTNPQRTAELNRALDSYLVAVRRDQDATIRDQSIDVTPPEIYVPQIMKTAA